MPNIIRFTVEVNGAGTPGTMEAARTHIAKLAEHDSLLRAVIMDCVWHTLPPGAKPTVGMAVNLVVAE